MATELSRYLRLRLDSNLTANARYNLERLDLLGSTLSIDNTNSITFRSRADMTFEPQSQSSGGSGIGGVMNIGTPEHSLAQLNIFADEITGIFPDQAGNAGKVLSTDGITVSWKAVAGATGVQSAETNWVTADGTTKIFSHGLSNTDLVVSVIDLDTAELINVDSVIVTGINSIQLSASEAPATSWRVVVHAAA